MNIQQMIDQRKITVENLNTQTSAITNTIFDNKDMLAEIINFLVEDYGYYFDEDFADPIAEYRKMNHTSYILSKTDRFGNWGFEDTYGVDEAIIDNLDTLLPIIQKYDTEPEEVLNQHPKNGIINGVEVDYTLYATVGFGVQIYEENLEKFDTTPEEFTKNLEGAVYRLYLKYDYSLSEIEDNLASYLTGDDAESWFEDVFEDYIPMKENINPPVEVTNYTPKIDNEIFGSTTYFKKYEELIDLHTINKMELDTVKFYVNNRDVDWTIKFNYLTDEFDLTGVYYGEEVEGGEQFVEYGSFKNIDELCQYLTQDHIDMEIDICLEELQSAPPLTAKTVMGSAPDNTEPSSEMEM